MAFPLLSWIESFTLMSCNEMDFVSTLFDTHTSLNSDTGTNSLYENSRENRIETRKRIFYPEMLLECSWDCFNDWIHYTRFDSIFFSRVQRFYNLLGSLFFFFDLSKSKKKTILFDVSKRCTRSTVRSVQRPFQFFRVRVRKFSLVSR